MTSVHRLSMATLGVLVAAFAGVASALGVFARGDSTFISVVSERGVGYEMANSGVYAFNARPLVAEGVGWDVFTLAVAVPAMVLATLFVARGSLRAQLVSIGLFGYFLYMYLEYSVTWAFGPLFPLFVAICGLSLAGMVSLSISVARAGVADSFNHFPVRAFVSLTVSLAALLTVMWSGRIAVGLGGDLVAAGLLGETTLVVQALDLGIVVPVALIASALVWQRDAAGYALAAALVVTAMFMASAITAMLVSAGLVAGDMPWPPMAVFGVFIVGYSWLAVRIYRGITAVRGEAASASTPSSATLRAATTAT